MMRWIYISIMLVLASNISLAQKDAQRTLNPKFEKEIDSYLSYSVPTITVNELKAIKDGVNLLDARELAEYQVSHIPNADFVGYYNVDEKLLQQLDKSKPVVVYCSIGYRSEKVAERLQKEGFAKVYNLYGSIFEWVNQGNEVCDMQDVVTNKVHTYNKKWSRWVDAQHVEKVWD